VTDTRSHWEQVWADTAHDETSWYTPEPEVSLELIDAIDPPRDARVLDVGGGASTLVDHLLDHGLSNVSVLDVAESALEKARKRLGERSARVNWIVGHVLEAPIESGVDIWHDRAVFHFLTEPEDRQAYADQLERCLSPDGHAIVATFSPEGPDRCSGLDVQRWAAPALANELGEVVELFDRHRTVHTTPWGAEQSFEHALLRKPG